MQAQDVTVKDGLAKLKEGTDYTVSYKDNKNAGKAYKVKGKVTAAGDKYYRKAARTATVTVKVK